MKAKKLIETKQPVIICEGDAEELMLTFLAKIIKNSQPDKQKRHLGIENFDGIENLVSFKKKLEKYEKTNCRVLRYTDFYFIYDNDLIDSQKIYDFIDSKNYKQIQLDPNIEGFIFSLIGKNIGENNKTELFRKKCKEKFKIQFDKEAHGFKNVDWVNDVFGEDTYNNIKILSDKNKNLKELMKLLNKLLISD